MSQVAARILGFYLEQAQKHGKSEEWLLEGYSYDMASLPDWMPWEDFCELTERLAELIGLDALEEAGTEIVQVSDVSFITRTLGAGLSAKTVHWASQKWGGPKIFPSVKTGYEELADGRLLLTLTIPEGDRDCEAFFRMNAGVTRAMPRVIGLPESVVELVLEPRCGRYFVQPPPDVSLFYRVRRAATLLMSPASDPSLPAFRQLADQHAEMRRRYHEAMAARDEARRARHQAERALAVKSEFLATMSHELRTPLHGVIATASLLHDDIEDAAHRKKIGVILRSGTILLDQINDLLDLAKVDVGAIELRSDSVELDQLFDDLVPLFTVRAERKGLEFKTNYKDLPDGPIVADHQRLRQVLANLLDNAVKFTSDGGIVLDVQGIRLEESNEWWMRFEVSDTGIGLAPQAKEWLFKPFATAEKSYTRQRGGAGLGLSICRRLVELMEGELGYESTLGEGTRFWFEVVFNAAEKESGEEEPTSQSVPVEVQRPAIGSGIIPSRPGHSIPPGPTSETGDTWLNVLVAEDNKINQLVTCAMLKKLSCRVELVGDGLQAVEAVEHAAFDVVLMDCRMPNMNGYDAARAIRDLGGDTSSTPILALTAHTLPEDHDRCIEAGMNGIIAKPATLEQLRSALLEHCSVRQTFPPPSAQSYPPPSQPAGPPSAPGP